MKKLIEEIKQEKKRKCKCNICGEQTQHWEKVNGKIYCVDHYEEAFYKKITCSQCSTSFPQGLAFGEKTAKFCSQECCVSFYKEQKQKDSLCKYIMEIKGLEKSSDIDIGTFTLMDKMRKQKRISYLAMEKVLKYGVKHNKIKLDDTHNILALIPYLFKEAEKYYMELKKVKEHNEKNVKILPTRTVIIKRKEFVIDNRVKDLLIQPSDLK